MSEWRQFINTGEWYRNLDGRYIRRKSTIQAEVYDDNFNIVAYNSRIEHCDSCRQEQYDAYNDMEECCCVHGDFSSKKEENEYVKSLGFWKLPFSGGTKV